MSTRSTSTAGIARATGVPWETWTARLDELNAAHEEQWRWVKGHAGDPGNERADLLANRGVDAVLG